MATDRRQREIEEATDGIGRLIAASCPPGCGFVLAMYEFGDPGGWCSYAANGQREDIAKFLRELATRLEGGLW